MRQSKRIFALLLVFITVLTLLPITASASYRYEALKFNSWYRLKDLSNTTTVYKLKVTTDTVIVVNWKNYNSDDHFGYGAFCTDKECDYSVGEIFLGFDCPRSGNTGMVLYRGTYYLMMYDGGNTAQVKFTKKDVKSTNKQNYCLQNAVLLKAGKKAEFAQTKKYNYHRWYKIKLTKSQPITLYGNILWYDIYDSNFNEIRSSWKGDNVISTEGTQSKGIYYLALHDYPSSLITSGKYYNFYWK